MLVELKVSNFLSICSEQVFSLVAGPGQELEENTISVDRNLRLVRTAAIYGANASGKSNLLSAIAFLKRFVLFSADLQQPGKKIPFESFAFDNTSHRKPTEIEITFIKDGIRYQYGFIITREKIIEEWLLAYPANHPQEWFSRQYDEKNDCYKWKFSNFLKGKKHQIGNLTRNNVLFLSNSVKLNNKQLTVVFDWFQNDLLLIDSPSIEVTPIGTTEYIEKLKDKINSPIEKERIVDFLKVADPSIIDVIVESRKIAQVNFPDDFPEIAKKQLIGHHFLKITFRHTGGFSLTLEKESEGTQKLFVLVSSWLDALDQGRILIIDEIDNSLHPLLVKFLIKLICDPKINMNNAQLIFSTHDTSLLDKDILRRDQIWFVEKDKKNSTQIYPLLDFSPRKEEAIGKGYLQGRYGALPYIGEWGF